MQSFFDHLLTINPPSIDKNNWPLTAEEYYGNRVDEFYSVRNTAYYNLLREEFQLQYHAHISIRDLDAMPVHERRSFLELLREQKKAEEDAIKASSKKK